MDSREFLARYKHVRTAEVHTPDERLNRISNKISTIATSYEHLTDSILNQDTNSPTLADNAASKIVAWGHGSYEDDIEYLTNRYNEETESHANGDKTYTGTLISRLNFVSLSNIMHPLWEAAANHEHLPAQGIGHVQTQLAVLAMNFLPIVEGYEKEGKLFVKDMRNGGNGNRYRLNPELGDVIGTITEIDAALTCLNISKRHHGVTILPSPGKYEHSRDSSINSDLLAIDMVNQQAAGIQVKSSFTKEEHARYDSSIMTFIDGKVDLDNIRAVRYPGSTKVATVTWPGLISLHHLAQQKNPLRSQPGRSRSGNFQPTRYDNALIQARLLGRQLVKRYPKPNLENANSILSERILYKLGRTAVH